MDKEITDGDCKSWIGGESVNQFCKINREEVRAQGDIERMRKRVVYMSIDDEGFFLLSLLYLV